jgi:two-component system, chemotaxis family, sensor kinase Cph1
LVYRLKLEGVHNQLIAKAAQDLGLAPMAEGTPNLLDGMDADGAALYYAKRWWRMGRTPTEVQLDALKTWLDACPELQTPTRQIYATDSLVRDYAYAAAFADVRAVSSPYHLLAGMRP